VNAGLRPSEFEEAFLFVVGKMAPVASSRYEAPQFKRQVHRHRSKICESPGDQNVLSPKVVLPVRRILVFAV
jgi:hypothetical protein